MAQRVQTILVDDVDGKELADGAGETVTFALDGVTYELDLSTKNAEKLRTSLQFYADHGRRVGGRKATTTAARSTPTKTYDTAAVKAWAASHKIDVPARGRIPKAVLEQYHAAGN